jgi:hypothetical protein
MIDTAPWHSGARAWSPAHERPSCRITVTAPALQEPEPRRQSRLATGLVTFGLSYIPAVIVASESDLSADHHLDVPLVGPWLDIANRPACGPNGPACDSETTNKVLIGVDGVFQGVGLVATVIGMLTTEHEEVVTTTAAKADKPTVQISPAYVGAGAYGLRAVASW